MTNWICHDRVADGADAEHAPKPLSVAVLVDLELADAAGGHVKCWQRFAEAATGFGAQLDLTVFFLGPEARRVVLSENVRYEVLPPCLGTRRFGFLSQGAGHTDLAPFHPALARRLRHFDLLHITDVFAFARTAAFVARWRRNPLVMSIHTDLPHFAEIYTAEVIRRLFGDGRFARFVLHDLRFAERNARGMRRRLHRLARRCDHVLYAHGRDVAELAPVVGRRQLSRLRRGVEKERFHPSSRDRERLQSVFGIPPMRPVLLFVGRLDESKQVMLAARVARRLLDRGGDLTFLAVGDGAQRSSIAALLGPHAVLPGILPQSELAWIYPSADLFIFPSQSETVGNVVLEARASGLPALVADCPGPSQLIRQSGRDGVVLPPGDARPWADHAEALLKDTDRRLQMGARARHSIEQDWPSWAEVLDADLMRTWRAVTAHSASTPAASDNGSNTGYGGGLQNA